MEQEHCLQSDFKMTSVEDDFGEFDDEYLTDLENMNENFIGSDDDMPLKDYLVRDRVSRDLNEDDYSRCLFPAGEEEDIDSEEEKDILKGIRDEIENKVRDEMKDELEVYQTQLLALEAGELGKPESEIPNAEETTKEEEEMDPRLKEALAKMRKLDKILMKKIRKEKEVKRERMLMEKRLRDEVAQMKHGLTNFSEIKSNTEKFLALSAPPSHNAGISLQDIDSDLPPLFQTEIDDNEIKKREKQDSQEDRNSRNSSQQNDCADRSSSPNDASRDSSRASKSGHKEGNSKSKKDFIQRNKELAAASNEVVAMTDDEKKRLHDLLEDIEEMQELEEGLDENSTVSFQLSLNMGDGFVPDNNELKSLTEIDSRLKSVMADDDYKSLVGLSVQSTPRQPLFTRVGVRTTPSLLDGFGERVLFETKEERDLKAKLQAIEKELEMFKAPTEMENGMEDFHLTDEQLDKLLDQCVRSSSRTSIMETPDSSARSNVSSRQTLLANPPKLSDEQLQQLLSEAHFPMSSQLMALREDDEKIMEGDGRTEMIRAETWKAIVDENLDSTPGEMTDSLVSNTEADPGAPLSVILNQNDNHGQSAENDRPQEKCGAFPDCDRNVTKHENDVEDSKTLLEEHSSPVISKNTSGNISSLPKITSSNVLHRQSLQSENNRSGCALPSNMRESSNLSLDSVRFPKISSNAFLIHTSQGLNNESEKSESPLVARKPLEMVHNDLSEMRLDSFSEDERDIIDRRSQRRNSPAIPRPPPGNKPKDLSK